MLRGTRAQTTQTLRQEIELRAYYRYCDRGCAPGADVNDWLAAEQEVLALRARPEHASKPSADDRPRAGRRRAYLTVSAKQ